MAENKKTDDDSGTSEQKFIWERKIGYVSEFKIDARWVMYEKGSNKPNGSLRIVSHPDCPAGKLKSICSIVTKRTPKTKQEIEETKKVKYDDTGEVSEVYNDEELELYSISEKLETWNTTYIAPSYELEERFGVKIF